MNTSLWHHSDPNSNLLIVVPSRQTDKDIGGREKFDQPQMFLPSKQVERHSPNPLISPK